MFGAVWGIAIARNSEPQISADVRGSRKSGRPRIAGGLWRGAVRGGASLRRLRMVLWSGSPPARSYVMCVVQSLGSVWATVLPLPSGRAPQRIDLRA